LFLSFVVCCRQKYLNRKVYKTARSVGWLAVFCWGGDKGARPGGWGLAATLRLLAAPKLVADSAVPPGIRVHAQARLARSSMTSRTELLPASSLRCGRSLREIAASPQPPGLAWWIIAGRGIRIGEKLKNR